MRVLLKQSAIILFLVLAASRSVFGESNFDIFFKNESQYKDVIVETVLSADRLRLQGKTGDKGELIKLIGIKAPKAPKKKTEDLERNEFGVVIEKEVSPLTPIEETAYEFARELLEGKHVRIEFDSEKKGEKYETLAYVFLIEDDIFVNAEILRQGFAHLRIRPPNMKYADKLREAYKEARSEKRGLQGQ